MLEVIDSWFVWGKRNFTMTYWLSLKLHICNIAPIFQRCHNKQTLDILTQTWNWYLHLGRFNAVAVQIDNRYQCCVIKELPHSTNPYLRTQISLNLWSFKNRFEIWRAKLFDTAFILCWRSGWMKRGKRFKMHKLPCFWWRCLAGQLWLAEREPHADKPHFSMSTHAKNLALFVSKGTSTDMD